MHWIKKNNFWTLTAAVGANTVCFICCVKLHGCIYPSLLISVQFEPLELACSRFACVCVWSAYTPSECCCGHKVFCSNAADLFGSGEASRTCFSAASCRRTETGRGAGKTKARHLGARVVVIVSIYRQILLGGVGAKRRKEIQFVIETMVNARVFCNWKQTKKYVI